VAAHVRPCAAKLRSAPETDRQTDSHRQTKPPGFGLKYREIRGEGGKKKKIDINIT
jgi:hypothetical protein